MLARTLALVCALAAPAAFAANAPPPPAAAPSAGAPRIDKMEAKLEQRIQKAQAKGKITEAQAKALEQKIASIRATEKQMGADGFTKDEKKALKQQLVEVKKELHGEVKAAKR